jgi:hypothetical protein
VIRAIAEDPFAVCDQIEEEVVRVLTRKFGWEAERVRADLAFSWLEALRVEFEGTITGSAAILKTNLFSNAPNVQRPSASSPVTTTCCRSLPTVAFAS